VPYTHGRFGSSTHNYKHATKRQPEFAHVTKRIKGVKNAIRHQQKDAPILSLVSAPSISELSVLLEGDDEEAAAAVITPDQQKHVVFDPAQSHPLSSPMRLRRRPLSHRTPRAEEVTFEDEPTLLALMKTRMASGHDLPTATATATASATATATATATAATTAAPALALPISPPLLPRCVGISHVAGLMTRIAH
jgi:hypothetical protein